jgi:hypothetical protein
MNVEKLHAICIELKQEITSNDLPGALQRLETALQQLVNQPNQPQHQQQIGSIRDELRAKLTAIDEQERPVVKRKIIDEIGGTELLGGNLLARIAESFQQVEVTPSLVHADINALLAELNEFSQGLDELIAGFRKFDIEAEELEPFTAELGVIIPRRNNSDDLDSFAKDMLQLNKELQAFSELVTGQADNFQIRTVSSSDISVFLNVLPETAQAVVSTVALLMFGYEKLLDIRKKRQELTEKDAPKDVIDPLDKWAESIMEEQILEITAQLMEEFKGVDRPDGRINEVETKIRLSTKKIAGRIDVGYHFSARVAEAVHTEEDSEEEKERKTTVVESIKSKASKLEHQNLSGEPVLPLDWRPEENEEE